MNVVYSSDENFVPYLEISIMSLLKNNREEFDKIHIYVLDNGIKDGSKDLLRNLSDENIELSFISVKDMESMINSKLEFEGYPFSAYSRLFLPSLIDNGIDKVLYLDADSLVEGSLKEIWEENMDEYYCAGVLDVIHPYFKLISMHEGTINDNYINTGFLLVNLKKWREENIEESFIEFINKYKFFRQADQDIINGVIKEKVLIIDPKFNILQPFVDLSYEDLVAWVGFNYYTKEAVLNAVENPVFIHFNQFINGRPWFINNTNNHYYEKYKEYSKFSMFKERVYIDGNINIRMKIIGILMKYLPMKFFSNIYGLFLKISN